MTRQQFIQHAAERITLTGEQLDRIAALLRSARPAAEPGDQADDQAEGAA